jgi:alpha-amylase
MNKLSFLTLIHNHQPIGNFDYVFENAYQKSYKPFLDTFKHFNLKISLHLSGPLYDWLFENHPEYLEEVKQLVKKGNIEIIGSGYYEPILAAIPLRDAISQLKLYKNKLETFFETQVSGAWLTERVWEPHLPLIFNKAGIKYIAIDDYHFLRSGLDINKLGGYYLVDFEDATLAVYPGSEKLRYIMPFSVVENVAEYFRFIYENNIGTIIFADDGEKFGIWPETYKWVYEEKWLEKFFTFLEENKSWIETKTFSEHFYNNEPLGICYFPTTSYPELGEWALPAEASYKFKKIYDLLKNSPNFNDFKPFFQGGQWKNFLSKYKESMVISKKMFFLSKLMENKQDDEKIDLYKAQCNDAYWHGVFGGLYLPHLRREIQSHLCKGFEKILPPLFIYYHDFDLDGKKECFVHNRYFNIIFDIDEGGSIISVDFIPKSLNITDTLTRRKEGYHYRLSESTDHTEGTKTIHEQFISKEKHLDKYLHYDKFYRSSCRIYLFDEMSLEMLYKHEFLIHDATIANYECVSTEEKNCIHVKLIHEDDHYTIKKHFNIEDSTINLRLEGKLDRQYTYLGLEWNFNLFAPDAPDRFIEIDNVKLPLNTYGEYDISKGLSIKDLWYGLKIDFDTKNFKKAFIYPVETVSLSESGAERTFQGTCLFLVEEIKNVFFDKLITLKVDIINAL